MAKASKSSLPARRPRQPKALHQLREALGLEGGDWQAFLRHARDGFADYERATWTGPASRLELEDVPETWFQKPEALGFVTLRVLAEGTAELATPVAQFFLRICDPGPERLCFAPGVGRAWLHLSRKGVACPLEPALLAYRAMETPEEFFQGVTEEDLLDLTRLILEVRGTPEAWDLHVLLAAVDRARLPGRAPFHLFHGLMSADWLPLEVKREFCRGLLGCQPQEQRLQARSGQVRAYFQSKNYQPAHQPRMELEVGSIGLRLMLPGLQRHAVRALVDAVREPAQEVIKEFLLRPERDSHYADMVQQGVLDVVHSHAGELGPEEVRKLLRKAIKKGMAIVRQAAYRIGLEQFGPEFARPALKDPAGVVSNWASKALATKTRKPRSLWE